MAAERGWLFDAYPKGDKMVVWLKRPDGSTACLEDDWRHAIFVGGAAPKLKEVAKNKEIASLVRSKSLEERFQRITDKDKSAVLKFELAQSTKALPLAEKIEKIDGELQLYNVYPVAQVC